MFKMARDQYRAKVETVVHRFYITGEIGYADEYLDLIDTLYCGSAQDTIFIHLNTPGGSFNTSLQIINAINASEATVVTIADGEVASAGTLILFSAPNIGVQDHSYALIHDGSYGGGGKINENLKQAQFISSLIKDVCKKCYGPFFTEEEIASILDGKDVWLTSEELNTRIVNSVKEENATEE